MTSWVSKKIHLFSMLAEETINPVYVRIAKSINSWVGTMVVRRVWRPFLRPLGIRSGREILNLSEKGERQLYSSNHACKLNGQFLPLFYWLEDLSNIMQFWNIQMLLFHNYLSYHVFKWYFSCLHWWSS